MHDQANKNKPGYMPRSQTHKKEQKKVMVKVQIDLCRRGILNIVLFYVEVFNRIIY